jgi:hypothetical protein
MAQRPIFIPDFFRENLVREEIIEFDWYPGMSVQQKRKSIKSLHEMALTRGISPVLEISTKSDETFGIELSAFNIRLNACNDRSIIVEAAFQGGKIFENGGPYKDLYNCSGRQIKKDERLVNSGKLIAFQFEDLKWDLEPKTAFYDWLYIHALYQNQQISKHLLQYKAFSDIEFNPKKSINCQARAAALYVALQQQNLISSILNDRSAFLSVYGSNENQISLPGF